MNLGLNLSFAVKRWMYPEELAAMIQTEFGVTKIEFTWDMLDPWWPEDIRDVLAVRWAKAFRDAGLEIVSSFGGLAGYTYGHLLAPLAEQRAAGLAFFKRAIDMTSVMGVRTIGTPIGGMSNEDSASDKLRAKRYRDAVDSLVELSTYAKFRGVEKILIEATPLSTEFPHSPAESLRLMNDLEGKTAVPVRLLLDWGHVLFRPLLGEQADMALWLRECQPFVEELHIQQTDGLLDRHWDFTREGIVTPELIRQVAAMTKTEHLVQFAEFVYPFEATDEDVFDGVKRSMRFLSKV